MTTTGLSELMKDAAIGMPVDDLVATVETRIRRARRRRRTAVVLGSTAVLAVGVTAVATLINDPGRRAGRTDAAGGPSTTSVPRPTVGGAVLPSAVAPLPTAVRVSAPPAAATGPAALAYFVLTPVPHKPSVLTLRVVTATGERTITGVADGNALAVSPDGNTLAITGSRDNPQAATPLRLVNLTTGATRTLNAISTNAAPRWSRNGRYLALVNAPAGQPSAQSNSPGIAIITVATGEARTIALLTGGTAAAWSPTNTELAVTGTGGHGVDIINVANGALIRRLVGTYALDPAASDNPNPGALWSPDGTRLDVYSLADNKPNEKHDIVSTNDGHIAAKLPLTTYAPWINAATLSRQLGAVPADHLNIALRPPH